MLMLRPFVFACPTIAARRRSYSKFQQSAVVGAAPRRDYTNYLPARKLQEIKIISIALEG